MIEKTQTTTVWAEPAQLQQVILNLCNNAAQAMDEPGLIELCIEAREIAQPMRVGRGELGPGRFLIVSVSDPGAGMDEATVERIFEPFFTTRPDGNGLGLATVREIVEDHGGAVRCKAPSAPERASTSGCHPLGSMNRYRFSTRRSWRFAVRAKPCLCSRRTADVCCGTRKFWRHSATSRSASQKVPMLWRPSHGAGAFRCGAGLSPAWRRHPGSRGSVA